MKKNSNYHMIIRVTDMELKDAFLAKAERLGLTISNDAETKTGIEHIQIGNCISVGTSDKFHINWARRINYYADRAIVPVYDIQLDWKDIIARLNDYAAAVEEEEEKEVRIYLTGDRYAVVDSENSSVDIYDEEDTFESSLDADDVEALAEALNL